VAVLNEWDELFEVDLLVETLLVELEDVELDVRAHLLLELLEHGN